MNPAKSIVMVGRRAVMGYSESVSVVSVGMGTGSIMCTGCKK